MWEIEERSLTVKRFKLAYTSTGPKDGRVLLCVHGLLSNGRDYDFLALHLAQQGYRVICVDLPGRGNSDKFKWFWNYRASQYIPYLRKLIDHEIGSEQFDWLGVSLGGMLGIGLSSMPHISLSRLILVDVGAELSAEALNLIAIIARQNMSFEDREEAVSVLYKRCAQWGIKDQRIWDHLARYNIIECEKGGYAMHYDPKIGKAIPKKNRKIALWPLWKNVQQPVLLIRGGQSKLLTQDLAQKMADSYSGSGFTEVVYPECGHVPNLMQDDHIMQIASWLKS